MNFKEIKDIKDKVMAGGCISREEAVALTGASNIGNLYYSANQLRAKFCGYRAHIFTSFTIAGNRCNEDCKFCAMSANTKIEHPNGNNQNFETLIQKIELFSKHGIRNIKLNIIDGNITDQKLDKIIENLKEVKSKCKAELLVSLGNISHAQLRRLKDETGIGWYHCNTETSERFYPNICTTNCIQSRYQTLTDARSLGFKISTGIIIGMGETLEDRIDMALKIRDLGIDTIFINLLYALEGTPLEKQPQIGSQEILTTFAIFRFLLPKAKLVLARGRSQIKIIEVDAINAGINSAILGELLVEPSESDIEYNKQLFEREGFTV